jgi:hypothetical protein
MHARGYLRCEQPSQPHVAHLYQIHPFPWAGASLHGFRDSNNYPALLVKTKFLASELPPLSKGRAAAAVFHPLGQPARDAPHASHAGGKKLWCQNRAKTRCGNVNSAKESLELKFMFAVAWRRRQSFLNGEALARQRRVGYKSELASGT